MTPLIVLRSSSPVPVCLLRWVPYPIQKHTRYLPSEEAEAIRRDLRSLRPAAAANCTGSSCGKGPAHFGEWLTGSFGRVLTESFMRPYNEKVRGSGWW